MSATGTGTIASIHSSHQSARAAVQPRFPVRRSQQSVAVYVIGGFLGSGKTTLLRGLLASAVESGHRPAVLMNEFAESNVEGALLASTLAEDVVEIRSLFTRCACCDHNRALTAEVGSMLRAGRGPIFVETDGRASLVETAAAVAEVGRGTSRGNLASVINVLDARRWRDQDWRGHDPTSDVRAADTIVLSRLDALSSSEVDAVASAVGGYNPGARIFTKLADFPLAAIGEAHRPDISSSRAPMNGHGSSQTTDGLESVTAQILGPVRVERLGQALARCPRVVRVKGVVRTTHAWGFHELQWVPGGRLDMSPARKPTGVAAHLTIVGQNIDWESFADDLDDCVLSTPAPSRRSA